MEVDQGHFQRIKLHKNCYDFAVQIKKSYNIIATSLFKKSVNRAKKACKSVVCKTHSTRVRFPPAAPNIYKLATCRRKIRGIHPIYNEKIRFDESIGSLVSQGFAKGNSQPKRTEVRCSRVVRNSKVGEDVKNLYDYFCQICGCRLILPAGPYAECCHIKAIRKTSRGDPIPSIMFYAFALTVMFY